MGQKDAGTNQQPNPDKSGGGGNAANPIPTPTETAGAKSAGDRNPVTATGEQGTGAGTVKVSSSKNSGLSTVKSDPPKRRGRHRNDCACAGCEEKRRQGLKPPIGQSAKRTKTAKTASRSSVKHDPNEQTRVMIEVLLHTGGSMPASRLGSHWVFKDHETKAIPEPLTRILDRYTF